MDIYKAISAVMADIGAIQKNDMNTYDKYKYRGIDAVYNAIQPALIKNGIFIVPNVEELEQVDRMSRKNEPQIQTRVMVRYEICASDGSRITARFPGEAIDRSDKSINKAMTAAFKYLLFELFCIPTEDLNDADKESPEAGTTMKAVTTPAVIEMPTEKTADERMTPAQVKKLQKMLDEAGIPYQYALDKCAKGVTDMTVLTKLQGNLIATHIEKIGQSYIADSTMEA